MAEILALFPTRVWDEDLSAERGFSILREDLLAAADMLAAEDEAGKAWARANHYPGYTSYGSLDDLPRRATCFADLAKRLGRRVRAFAAALELDLGPKGRLVLDNLWVSILEGGGSHSGHIHPASVVSGVIYLAAPKGAGQLRLEDPRLPLMMAAPPPRPDAQPAARRFALFDPSPGRLLLWESWLRHEVLPARGKRVSVSFNFAWR